jgi:hypothetical protein
MTNELDKKAMMAELLVRQTLGNTTSFTEACKLNNLSLEEGVRNALVDFMNKQVSARAKALPSTLLCPSMITQPDVSDCPNGQEDEWIELCEHDLRVLRNAESKYSACGDMVNSRRAMVAIEGYLQTLSALRERTKCG